MAQKPIQTSSLIELYQQGATSREVAERFGLSCNAVCARLRKAGVPIRPRGESLSLAIARGRRRTFDGRDNPKYRAREITGVVRTDGYRGLIIPGHPMADANGMVLEHRKIVADWLGRPLLSEEVVHHRNHDRTDNSLVNLQVMSQSEHARAHGFGAVRGKKADA